MLLSMSAAVAFLKTYSIVSLYVSIGHKAIIADKCLFAEKSKKAASSDYDATF